MKQRIGIVGFRGYSGAELVGLLQRHPALEPVLLEHRADAEDRPEPLGYSGPARLPLDPAALPDSGLVAVALATPPEVSMELTPALLSAGVKVVDLSGAYRLRTTDNYTRWYKEPHHQPDLLDEAAYGLPEWNRTHIRTARLVANPGCYPTAANLALRPLVDAGLIERAHGIVCDAKSGVSGAGRKPTLKTHFCEVTDNFTAYSVLTHRHVPEILQTSGLNETELSFTAQLLPIERGILETIYCRVLPGVSAGHVNDVYRQAYRDEPFVRLYRPGQSPDLRGVLRTNFCDLGVHVDEASGRTVIVSVIDNLVKGAAGQALQNLNLLLGHPEEAGLLT